MAIKALEQTDELAFLRSEIKEKSKADFLRLCKEEEKLK